MHSPLYHTVANQLTAAQSGLYGFSANVLSDQYALLLVLVSEGGVQFYWQDLCPISS